MERVYQDARCQGGSLREMAQREQTGPVMPAAAHVAEGLQRRGVCAAGQQPERADAGALTADLKAAREGVRLATGTAWVGGLAASSARDGSQWRVRSLEVRERLLTRVRCLLARVGRPRGGAGRTGGP
jgi:hypothetical protein